VGGADLLTIDHDRHAGVADRLQELVEPAVEALDERVTDLPPVLLGERREGGLVLPPTGRDELTAGEVVEQPERVAAEAAHQQLAQAIKRLVHLAPPSPNI